MITGGSVSGKKSPRKRLIKINKHYLYVKDPYEPKYLFLIYKCKSVDLEHFNDNKVFPEYLNNMQDVYKNSGKYSPGKERRLLTVFNNMIIDMISCRKPTPIVAKLCTRVRKLNISLVFITQPYFKVPKDVRLNPTYFFIIQITMNHLSDIGYENSMKIYKKCTAEPY